MEFYNSLCDPRVSFGVFHKFENWVAKHMNNEEEFEKSREIGFQFDGVDIRLAGMLQTSNLQFEYWKREVEEDVKSKKGKFKSKK